MSSTPEMNGRTGPAAAQAFARTDKISVDETEVVAWLSRGKTGPSHVMLDVGAHFGFSAGYFDELGWSIHCFEPDPNNRAKLEAKFGTSPNVRIDPRAVSDEPATGVSLFQSDESTGISGLHAFRDTHRETDRVDVTTIADVVTARDINHVDFLKIDVEGFDFNVIKGVPWGHIRPEVIECEFEDNKTVPLGHTYREVAQYLVDKGYSVYLSEWHPIIRYGIRHDWRRVIAFPSPKLADDAWGNILAFREDPGLAALEAAFDTVISRTHQLSPTKGLEQKPAAGNPASVTKVPTVHTSHLSFRQRFSRWSRANSPLLHRAGRFGLWGARHGRHRPLLAILALLIPAVLIAGAIGVQNPTARMWLAVAASASIALLGSAAAAAYILTMMRRRLRETNQRLDRYESGMRDFPAFKVRVQQLTAAAGRLDTTINVLDTEVKPKLDEFGDRFDIMLGEISSISRTIRQFDRVNSVSSVYNLEKFQTFKRHLTDLEVKTLINDWSEPLGLELKRNRLAYLAHRAAMLESLMKGRLATAIETIVLRTLVCMAVKREDIEILEIGTLFGVGAAALYEAATNEFSRVHLTLIDPLDGYYGAQQRDILTGTHVTEAALRHNLRVAQVPVEDYSIIKRLSEDKQTIADAASRTYDVLIIDGDHSRAGVKRDFDNYVSMVRPGGYVIFDDYGTDHWPEIKTYVDEEVEGLPGLKRVGADFRTAVYQVLENDAKPVKTAAPRKVSTPAKPKQPAKSARAAKTVASRKK